MNANESINQLFNLLNELINRNDLSIRIINLSNELLGTLEIIENCEDEMGEHYWSKTYKSIREIENYLVELEKGEKKKQEKEDIIYKLGDELIKIDALCKACGGKHLINKLS